MALGGREALGFWVMFFSMPPVVEVKVAARIVEGSSAGVAVVVCDMFASEVDDNWTGWLRIVAVPMEGVCLVIRSREVCTFIFFSGCVFSHEPSQENQSNS